MTGQEYLATAHQDSLRLCSEGQFDDALGLLQKAIAQAEAQRDVKWILALTTSAAIVAEQAERLDLAVEYFERALVHADDAHLHLGLARLLRSLGNDVAADEHLNACLIAAEREQDARILKILEDLGFRSGERETK